MCEHALKNFFQPLGKRRSSAHCREIPRCYFWFLYILCSELLYKGLPPPLCFFSFWHFSFSHPFSRLLVVSLSGRIIWNPLGKALISHSSFHSRMGLRKGCLGISVYIFPWIGLTNPMDGFSFATAILEDFTNAVSECTKLASVSHGTLNSC